MASLRKCVVRVDGKAYADLFDDLITVEVADRAGEPSSFALQIGIHRNSNGTWNRLDEVSAASGGFQPWQRITIAGGYGDPDVLFDGYVAGVAPHFAATSAESYLLVWGHDASHAMDVEEKVVAWPDKKYSDIATAVFNTYGLTPKVTDTEVVHKAADNLLMQRSTDWQYLRYLADRVGFDVSVRGATGIFGPPNLSATPQKDLAIQFGESTNVVWFEPRVVGDMPSRIAIARTNALTKVVEKTEVKESPLIALGRRGSDSLRDGRLTSGKAALLARPEPVSDQQSMEALARGLRRRSDWILSGEGEVDGALYGAALRAGGTVLIKGAGKTFSGLYYVTETVHCFTPHGYSQRFKVMRNAVDLDGSERPQASDGARVTVSTSGRVVAP